MGPRCLLGCEVSFPARRSSQFASTRRSGQRRPSSATGQRARRQLTPGHRRDSVRPGLTGASALHGRDSSFQLLGKLPSSTVRSCIWARTWDSRQSLSPQRAVAADNCFGAEGWCASASTGELVGRDCNRGLRRRRTSASATSGSRRWPAAGRALRHASDRPGPDPGSCPDAPLRVAARSRRMRGQEGA
jgi:hypothetical protein